MTTRRIGITDPLPQALESQIGRLCRTLDARIPKASRINLLVATWNLRELGGLTFKWKSDPKNSPRRDLFSIRCIAEIVSRFDVVAIQEVQADLTALNAIQKQLGERWAYIVTDVTKGRKGNGERLGFLFDRTRVETSGLMGEIVVPDDEPGAKRALKRQFARTPFAASFASRGFASLDWGVLVNDVVCGWSRIGGVVAVGPTSAAPRRGRGS